MPLPERPNVGEFVPTIEPPAPQRSPIRWRIVPITLLVLPTLAALSGGVVAASGIVMRGNLLGERSEHPWYNDAQWLERSIQFMVRDVILIAGPLITGVAGVLAIVWLVGRRFRRATIAIIVMLVLVAIARPVFIYVIPWSARRIAELRYPGASFQE